MRENALLELEKEHIVKDMEKYPVLIIKNKENTDCLYGCKVRVEYNSRTHGRILIKGQLRVEDGKFSVMSMGGMIKDTFDYDDVMEMAEYANAPIIKKGEKVLLVSDMGKKKCIVSIMQVSSVDPNGINCAYLK